MSSSSSNSQAHLTPRGVSSPLKDALLDRYHHVRAAFNQPAFIESLNLPAQVLADIWLPVGFPPVSFEPLNEEEEKVAQTGQFTNANIRSRINQKYGHSSGEYGTSPSSSSGSVNSNNNNNNNRQNARGNQRNFRNHQNGPQSSRFQRQEFDRRQDHEDDEFIEDPDNLWVIPSADAVGSSDFGSFDENGMFRAGGIGASSNPLLDGGLEDISSVSASFESFMQTRPQPKPQPAAVAAAPVSPTAPTVAIPTITPNTMWLYRDPSGQIQGPFPSHRMMEWYNGKYFPESLPLRREQDSFFEPLSSWKIKCAGQVPFAAYTKTPEQNPTEKVIEKPVERPAEKVVEVQPKPVPTAAAVASTVAASPAATTTRSVPLESLFGNSLSAAPVPAVASIEKPSSPEVLMPGSSSASAAAGWKKLEKPSITTRFGQMNLGESVQPERAVVETPVAPSDSSSSVTAATFIAATPVVPAAATWSTPSSSAAASNMKKISLSEILKSPATEEPEIVLPKESDNNVPPTSASPVGWAKVSATPVKPLSAIQAEEAARQSDRAKKSASSAAASKSFADLVRSAGVITSGDIVVSPSVSDSVKPTLTEAIVASKPAPAAPIKKSEPAPIAKSNTTSAPTNTVVSSTSNANNANVTTTTITSSLEDWCVASLKASPALSKSIDPQVCTSLLLDLPNPASILTFALETLKPLDTTGSLDMAAFAQEFSTRKFGPKATEKVQWAKLKSLPSSVSQEESFEVVKRKK